jgi:mRNA-degrading endonuclease toxin of MazEF toxin-antitoxin module
VIKDFDRWNELKKNIENRSTEMLFHEGEIWWCSIGINVAVESCGKGVNFRRPVLVLKKISRNGFIGIPLTSKAKDGYWYLVIKVHGKDRWLSFNQIRTFSVKRLHWRMTSLRSEEIIAVKQKLETLLELSSSPEASRRFSGKSQI